MMMMMMMMIHIPDDFLYAKDVNDIHVVCFMNDFSINNNNDDSISEVIIMLLTCQSSYITLKSLVAVEFPPPNLHLASSEQWCWSGGRGILTELSLSPI